MEWWRWVAAAVEAILLIVLVLLWIDTLREKPGWTSSMAVRPTVIAVIGVPLAFLIVLVVPLWLGLVLIGIPALAIVTMALAS